MNPKVYNPLEFSSHQVPPTYSLKELRFRRAYLESRANFNPTLLAMGGHHPGPGEAVN